MSKKQEFKLFFVSLICTMLIFTLIGVLLYVSAKGIQEVDTVIAIEQPEEHQVRISVFEKSLQLDYGAMSKSQDIRQQYAPLLTSRRLLTIEYIVGYTKYWGNEFYGMLEEYFFQKEVYHDAVKV